MTPAKTTATIHSLRPKLLKPQDGSETRLVQTSVAMVLGLNAALFLQQLNFRLRTPSHVVEGVAWYEASYASLQAVDFPFWSEKTIARITRRLEKRGIITARPMSRNTYDRTKWYTINDEKLAEALGSTTGQSVPLEGTACPHHDQDTVSPSLEEEKREKKEPEGEVAIGVEEEDSLPPQPQIETVDTLEEHRGRGLARATVLVALGEAKASGCDLVFLVADEEDWPKQLYAKLGFDPLCYLFDFLLMPDR